MSNQPNKPKRYPRWITTPAGVDMIVKTCVHHSEIMGQQFNEDAELVETKPTSSRTIKEILATGSALQAALEGAVSSEPKEGASTGQRFIKIYPCGCQAGPGPASMPNYCPDHGWLTDKAECETIPYVEPAAGAAEPEPPVEQTPAEPKKRKKKE